MMGVGLFMVLTALAPADEPTLRPEVAQAVAQARALALEFEEAKALELLAPVAARTDLTAEERAEVEAWRGVAQASLLKEDDARHAFALARGCNPLMELPKDTSPKIIALFQATAPGDCPAAADAEFDPESAVTADAPASGGGAAPEADTPAPSDGQGAGGGPKPLALGGGAALAGAGGLVGLSVLVVVAAVGLLVASFPVVAQAQAQQRAADVRQQASVALGMRLGGASAGVVGVLLLLPAVGAGAAGVALLVLGLTR